MKMSMFKNTGNILIIGFIAFALGMLGLVYMSTQVKFDMAADGDYYQKEMEFNKQLDAEANALPFTDSFALTQDGAKIVISLPSNLSSQITEGFVRFYCLPDSRKDVVKPIAASTDGRYSFDRNTVAFGHNYIVKLSFQADGKKYYKEFKML